jgi:hypothetical protein
MLENMTTEEKVIAGITAVGIAALVFHKPTRSAVGLSDRVKSTRGKLDEYGMRAVRVMFDDGTSVTTNMSKNLTNREIKNYYKVGKKFGNKKVIKTKILAK